VTVATPQKMLFSAKEAAALLSLSRAHVYRLWELGELESVHIGRRRLITREQLDAYVANLTREAAAS
jgi:excisionase family DNA binding protein